MHKTHVLYQKKANAKLKFMNEFHQFLKSNNITAYRKTHPQRKRKPSISFAQTVKKQGVYIYSLKLVIMQFRQLL